MKPFKKIAIAVLAASVAGPALLASQTAFAQNSAAIPDGGPEIQEMPGMQVAHMGEPRGFGPGLGPRGGRERAERLFERFDTNGDDMITAAEIEDVRVKDFAEADTDGNGEISLEEFKAGFLERSNDRMVRAFQFLDRDGDGTVTQEEADTIANRLFTRLDRDGNGVVEPVRNKRGQRGPQAGERGGPDRQAEAGERPGRGPNDMDRDGRGPREMQRGEGGPRDMERGEPGRRDMARGPGGRHGMGHGPRGPHGMGRGPGGPQHMFMALFDTNGNGTVTRDDFDAKRAELFALADTNSSGSFTLEDFAPLWLAVNEERIVHMFQRADADGSLGISSEEHAEGTSKMMERADRNGDGVITKADFKRGMKGKWGKRGHRG